MTTINDRFRTIIAEKIPKKNQYRYLSEISGIPETTWRTWNVRNSAPNAQMIEAIAKKYPYLAFWLVTGAVQSDHGHTTPDVEISDDRKIPAGFLRSTLFKPRTPISANQHSVFVDLKLTSAQGTEIFYNNLELDDSALEIFEEALNKSTVFLTAA